MSEPHWARLAEDANRGLRRGAWYGAPELMSSDAALDVKGQFRVAWEEWFLGGA